MADSESEEDFVSADEGEDEENDARKDNSVDRREVGNSEVTTLITTSEANDSSVIALSDASEAKILSEVDNITADLNEKLSSEQSQNIEESKEKTELKLYVNKEEHSNNKNEKSSETSTSQDTTTEEGVTGDHKDCKETLEPSIEKNDVEISNVLDDTNNLKEMSVSDIDAIQEDNDKSIADLPKSESKDEPAKNGATDEIDADIMEDIIHCNDEATKLELDARLNSEIDVGKEIKVENTCAVKIDSVQKNERSIERKAEVEGDITPQDDWGWDSWADDFISQTANKVSSLLETMENQLGIPDPKEVAQATTKEKSCDNPNEVNENEKKPVMPDTAAENANPDSGMSSWFSSFVPVSSISNLVQSTGQELVTGGIDALEFLGKKTVNILSEGDPGLRSTRDQVLGKKSTLSSLLQEAKIQSEQDEHAVSVVEGDDPTKFTDMFEKCQGLANLEALEMLSKECDNKLERILNAQSDDAKDESMLVLSVIKKRLELDEDLEVNDSNDDGNFKKEIYLQSKKLQLKVTCSKLLNTWSKLKEKTTKLSDVDSVQNCFESLIISLAEFTSRCIEYYRKLADMLMMTDMQAKQLSEERASTIKRITTLFQMEVSVIGNSFANYLAENNKESASSVITDIYLENSNCVSLLHDAHKLLNPILQLSAIK